MPRDPERYEQGDDGLIVEKVGRWAEQKIKIVTDYVFAAGGARKNYRGPKPYIELFCGPGRSAIRDTMPKRYIDGSAVAAFKRSLESPAPFTSIYISDADDELLGAATKRLTELGAPVHPVRGPASEAVSKIVQRLDPYGLHLAFLDPHNLRALSFDLFEQLAKLKRIDIIAHVSLHDLRRNAGRYTSEAHDEFDRFAPEWRGKVGTEMSQEALRRALIKYWIDKVLAVGLPRAKHEELIRGNQGQHLYWLFLLARNKLAHGLWERISSAAEAPTLDF
jgi:three-Cys-motif partner protein